MKKIIVLSFGLLVVFVVSAIAHLPAQLVVNNAPLPAQLTLTGVQGTVWQGSATNVRWQSMSLGQLHWSLAPAKLLTGAAEAQVRFGQGSDMQLTGRGTVGYQFSGTPYLENVVASMPVEEIIQRAPNMPIPLALDGRVELMLKQLNYAAPFCSSAEGSVVWNTDKVGTPLADLTVGPVIADFTCTDSTINLNASQQSAQVESAAEVTLQPNFSYQSKGWFKPSGEFPASLTEQLRWLPDPDSSGRYSFNYNGRL